VIGGGGGTPSVVGVETGCAPLHWTSGTQSPFDVEHSMRGAIANCGRISLSSVTGMVLQQHVGAVSDPSLTNPVSFFGADPHAAAMPMDATNEATRVRMIRS
jgi:hypothetical protein